DLLPADLLLAVSANRRARTLDEGDVVLARRRGRLVAADVDVFARSEGSDLAQDVLHELGDARVRHVEGAEADVDARVRGGLVRGRRGLGVRDGGRVHGAGHVDLGHDDDTARRRVLPDRAVLLLRVPAAGPAADGSRAADLREPRPRADLEPPALVVREM